MDMIIDEIEKALTELSSSELQQVVRLMLRVLRTKELKTMPTVPQKTDLQMSVVEKRIAEIFVAIGIPAHLMGYQYLREAVKLCVADPQMISGITKRLYPDVAKKFHTSAAKVERAMRHALSVCWNRGKIETINAIFGNNVFTKYDRPANGEFIALLADKLLLELIPD